MISQYVSDISKIIEGALGGDSKKMLAYAEHLVTKLERDGDLESANRMRDVLNGKSGRLAVLARAAATPQMPTDDDSGIPLADEEFISGERSDVVLSPRVEAMVQKFLAHFRAAPELARHGVGLVPSLLTYGPPGCGKTMLARRIARELSLPLITARTDGLISSYLGSTAKNLRMLFDHAMSHPSVLFLDEFDALAKMRDDDRELGELKRVVISLLQNIDAMGSDHVLLAATNHDHLLDSAIWRRFSYKIELGPPVEAARKSLFSRFLGSFSVDLSAFHNANFIDIAAALSDGLTGAQIRDITTDSVREAILAERETIDASSLMRAIINANGNTAEDVTDAILAVKAAMPDIRQAALANIFGLTQPRISQILRKGSNGRRTA